MIIADWSGDLMHLLAYPACYCGQPTTTDKAATSAHELTFRSEASDHGCFCAVSCETLLGPANIRALDLIPLGSEGSEGPRDFERGGTGNRRERMGSFNRIALRQLRIMWLIRDETVIRILCSIQGPFRG